MTRDAYIVRDYVELVADGGRIRAYHEALRQAVGPGSVVADIGTGIGVFALIAAKFGARRVYAIDPAAAIEVGPQLARDNGFAEQIEFIPEFSTHVSLPERVDVIVSELRGVLPLFSDAVPAIVDARQRFLAEGGTMIPSRDLIYAALIEAPDLYPNINGTHLGLDFSATEIFAVSTLSRRWIGRDQLLVEPAVWGTLDYHTVTSPHLAGDVSWRAARDGTAHGVCMWMDSELIDGVWLSSAPGEPKTIYTPTFFPLAASVEVARGDRIRLQVQARLVGDTYIWRWRTEVAGNEKASPPKASFDQSTLRSTVLSPARLQRREAGYIATLNDDGEIDRQALTWMDGATSLAEIADRLMVRFPDRFANQADALRRVASLSAVYSR